MKVKSQLVTQMSGSLGGVTGSHNRGGMYLRARSIPTNPSSPYQQAVRSAMTAINNRWVGTLTDAQRAAWADYAANVELTDTLGEPRAVTGLNMYARTNVVRHQLGLGYLDVAPSEFDTGGSAIFNVGGSSVDADADELSIAFANDVGWSAETGGYLGIWISRPQSPTINYFRGPYRYAGKIAGDDATPPTSPATIALPFPCVAGQRIFVQTRGLRADGRLTAPFRGVILAA